MKAAWSLLVLGVAFAGAPGAIAAPMNGTAIKAAAEQVGLGESVHCRPWRHWHRWGFGRGCRGVYYDYGPSVRFGFRDGRRFGHREGFDVRTRERFGTREGGRGDFRGGTTFRSGGRAGEVSPRGEFRSGGQASGGGGRMGGGQMRSAPTGGGAAMPGGGGGGGGGRGHGGENKQ